MSFISNNIKHFRKRRLRLNQIELAEKLGITQSNVSSYEKGKSFPSEQVFKTLSALFDVSIDDLINKDLTKDYYEEEESSPLVKKLINLERENSDLRALVDTQKKLIDILTSKD